MAQRRKWKNGMVVGGWRVVRCYTKKEPTQAHLVECTHCGTRRRMPTNILNCASSGCRSCVMASMRKYTVEKGEVHGTNRVVDPWDTAGKHMCVCMKCGEFRLLASTRLATRCKNCAKTIDSAIKT